MIEPYSGDDTVEFNGVEMRIRDVPSAFVRAGLGVGHFPGHCRQVVEVPGRTFPHTPETCLVDMHKGEWLPDGTQLYCTGCGLDGT